MTNIVTTYRDWKEAVHGLNRRINNLVDLVEELRERIVELEGETPNAE